MPDEPFTRLRRAVGLAEFTAPGDDLEEALRGLGSIGPRDGSPMARHVHDSEDDRHAGREGRARAESLFRIERGLAGPRHWPRSLRSHGHRGDAVEVGQQGTILERQSVERLVDPAEVLGRQPLNAEVPQRHEQPHVEVDVGVVDRPQIGGAQVAEVGGDLSRPRGLVSRSQTGLGPLGEVAVEDHVSGPRLGRPFSGGQSVGCEVTQGREHPVAGLASAEIGDDHRAVGEIGEQRQHVLGTVIVPADGARRPDRPPTENNRSKSRHVSAGSRS